MLSRDRQVREQGDVLEDHPDPPSLGRDGRRRPGHPPAADLDRSRHPGVSRPAMQPQDRGLATARRPEDGQHLAWPDLEIDVVDRDDVAEDAAQAALDRGPPRDPGVIARPILGAQQDRDRRDRHGQQQRRRHRPRVRRTRTMPRPRSRSPASRTRSARAAGPAAAPSPRSGRPARAPATSAGRRYGTVSRGERPGRAVAQRPARLLEPRAGRCQGRPQPPTAWGMKRTA